MSRYEKNREYYLSYMDRNRDYYYRYGKKYYQRKKYSLYKEDVKFKIEKRNVTLYFD